jgi:hypothetical protein
MTTSSPVSASYAESHNQVTGSGSWWNFPTLCTCLWYEDGPWEVVQDPERCRARECSAVRGWNTWGSCGFGQHKTVQTKGWPYKPERLFLVLLTPAGDFVEISFSFQAGLCDGEKWISEMNLRAWGWGIIFLMALYTNNFINFPVSFSHFSYSTFHWEFRETPTQQRNLCPRQWHHAV